MPFRRVKNCSKNVSATASAKASATGLNDHRTDFCPKPKESNGIATSRQTIFTKKLIA